jgi:hypothetical protein
VDRRDFMNRLGKRIKALEEAILRKNRPKLVFLVEEWDLIPEPEKEKLENIGKRVIILD